MRAFVTAVAALGIVAAATVSLAHEHDRGKAVLTLEGAKQVVSAAVAEARRLNAPGGAIAVVDDGGHPIYLERLDDTFPAGSQIAIGKARTAAVFKRPTRVFEEVINKGRTSMTTLPDFTPLMGGVPILVDGKVVGAIGVSGAASAQQDEEIAVAGAAVMLRPLSGQAGAPVTHFDAERVAAAFAKGQPLLEVPGYKVHASRRTGPGQAELHTWETDVFYVLEGSATFVTGGEVVDPKMTAPGEFRGAGIEGGEARTLRKGDVIVIPEGTPHWFKDVAGPFLYLTVTPILPHGGVN
jgi:glc operon protein GlcG